MISTAHPLHIFTVCLLLCVPLCAQAADVRIGGFLDVPDYEVLSENLYIAGSGDVRVAGLVQGDIMAIAARVILLGTTTNDIGLLAATTTLGGVTLGDVRLIAREAFLTGSVAGDTFVVGGVVETSRSFIARGDTRIFASRLTHRGTIEADTRMRGDVVELNGTITGTVYVTFSDRLIVGDNAVINGTLIYEGPRDPQISAGAVIDTLEGEVVLRTPTSFGKLEQYVHFISFFFSVASFFALLLASLLLIRLFPRFTTRIVVDTLDKGALTLFVGLGALVVPPVVALVVFLSVVGYVLAIVGFLSWSLLIVAASVLKGIFAGALLSLWIRGTVRVSLVWTVGGVVILEAMTLMPVIGALVNFCLLLAMLGALVIMLHRSWWRTRKKEETDDISSALPPTPPAQTVLEERPLSATASGAGDRAIDSDK